MNTKEIVRQFYEEVVTRNELELVEDYVSPTCVVRIGNNTFAIGAAGMKEHITATKTMYPGYHREAMRNGAEL